MHIKKLEKLSTFGVSPASVKELDEKIFTLDFNPYALSTEFMKAGNVGVDLIEDYVGNDFEDHYKFVFELIADDKTVRNEDMTFSRNALGSPVYGTFYFITCSNLGNLIMLGFKEFNKTNKELCVYDFQVQLEVMDDEREVVVRFIATNDSATFKIEHKKSDQEILIMRASLAKYCETIMNALDKGRKVMRLSKTLHRHIKKFEGLDDEIYGLLGRFEGAYIPHECGEEHRKAYYDFCKYVIDLVEPRKLAKRDVTNMYRQLAKHTASVMSRMDVDLSYTSAANSLVSLVNEFKGIDNEVYDRLERITVYFAGSTSSHGKRIAFREQCSVLNEHAKKHS